MASTSTWHNVKLPDLPQADGILPETAALDAFKLAAAQYVARSLELPLDKALEGIESGRTGKSMSADFQVAVPRFRLKGDPKAFAKKIADEFEANEYIESCAVHGIGVTFMCRTTTLTALVLSQINYHTHLFEPPVGRRNAFDNYIDHEAAEKVPSSRYGYGTNQSGEGKKIIIEFSAPNIAKPFHAGHLRSTIIGAFLANLYEANGWDVLRMNYLGDWGKQFGLLAVGWEKYGSEDELKGDAVKHLYDVYVKINRDAEADESIHERARSFFKQMEDGDKDAIALWTKFRDLSIVKLKDTYARLNTHFDVYNGESQVSAASQRAALDRLESTGIMSEDKGALLVDLTKYKLEKTVVRKRDGTYVYITRDIGGAVERFETHQFDKMIYVIASQQDLHTAQFFKVLDLMGYEWADRLQHVNFGMVTGMSTRKGTAVFLDQILNESHEVMHEQMRTNPDKYAQIEDPEQTSDILGVTAVKIQDMSAKRINNYKFEWSRMTSFEGDTGPYMQYAHVRLSSVERRVAPDVVLPAPTERASTVKTDVLTEPAARNIVLLLAQYPDVVRQASKSLEPSNIVQFCFRLCHIISTAWEVLIVRGQEKDVALARLWLFVCARDVLANAMRLLTLTPVERM